MLYAATIGDEFTDLLGNVVDVAIKVLIFLVIMALGWLVARWMRKWLAPAACSGSASTGRSSAAG